MELECIRYTLCVPAVPSRVGRFPQFDADGTSGGQRDKISLPRNYFCYHLETSNIQNRTTMAPENKNKKRKGKSFWSSYPHALLTIY